MRSHEHRSLGDDAAGGELVPLDGASVDLTYGDVVALAGDYFRPGGGEQGLFGGRPDLDDEVVCALHVAAVDEQWPDPRVGPGGSFGEHRIGAETERRVRDRYLALAAVNDDHFVAPGHSDAATGSGAPSAGAAYQRLHQVALDEAWRAGRAGADLATVIAREAAAQHYLTDAFAAGHLRTPVADIRRYWKARYPEFWTALQGKVAADTARALRELSGVLRLLPTRLLEGRAGAELARRTSRYPELSLGDLVARMFHDWDNDHGLAVEGGGVVFGDGRVEDGTTTALAVAAARAGIDDMEVAHRLGASAHGVGGPALYGAVREATGAGDRFRPEALVPRLSPGNPLQNWRAASIDELWAAPVVGTRGATVGEALEEMLAPGGVFIRQVDALGQGLTGNDGVFALPVIGTWLARRCCTAFHQGFVEPLSADPGGAIRSLVPRSDPPAPVHLVTTA